VESDPSRPLVPILSFLGAAGTVTGSRFLLDTPRSRVLVDAGMFQGLRKLRRRNWEPFPVPPDSIDALVLTHAHLDHIGYLPALVRDGFRGEVVATPGTASLAGIVLPDSGHLQEEEAAFANRMGFSKHSPALPLYTEADAQASLASLRPRPYGTEIELSPDVRAELRPAGHILGSATVTLRHVHDGAERTTVFSGDLGRIGHPLLGPPAPIGDADTIVMESTYGGRVHPDEGAVEELLAVIRRTFDRGGTVVIPAFAVDRTEVVLFHLRQLVRNGELPEVPIFVDSPMALAALRVYRAAIQRGDPEIAPELDTTTDPFDAGELVEIQSVEESKALSRVGGPAIIVSASGMATGGRVVHHLHRLLPDPRNSVVLVGFQAPGTRGRRLVEGEREVKLLGRHVPVEAEVAEVNLSIHADQTELCEWLGTASRRPDAVYIVHGEPAASAALAEVLRANTGWNVVVPRHGERVRLD
jgi:metallo-beta-lactamase family protein